MARPPMAGMLDASAAALGVTDDDPTRHAVALVALAHDTRDKDQWGGLRYWDQLVSRVLLATYRADTLAGWWEQMCRQMGCGQPTKAEDRALLASTIAADAAPVLDTLAGHTEALCLRVRLAWEHHFGPRAAASRDTTDDTQESLL